MSRIPHERNALQVVSESVEREPDLFQAIREQLSRNLSPIRGPVNILVAAK